MVHHILHMLSQTTLSGPPWNRNITAEGHLSGRERETQEFLGDPSWVVSHAQLYQWCIKAVLFVYSKLTENECARLSEKQSLLLALCNSLVWASENPAFQLLSVTGAGEVRQEVFEKLNNLQPFPWQGQSFLLGDGSIDLFEERTISDIAQKLQARFLVAGRSRSIWMWSHIISFRSK